MTRVLSWLTVSRWAMDAYGATINLARLPQAARLGQSDFAHTAGNLVAKWQILGVYALVCFVAACARLAWRDEER